jgi:hypothetical protein
MNQRNKKSFVYFIIVLILVGLACNVGGSEESDKPSVVINSPADSSNVTMGVELMIMSTSFSKNGIARVELRINGQAVSTDTSVNNPETHTANMSWTPMVEGAAVISVVAYDPQGNESDPAMVTLQVVQPGQAPQEEQPTDQTPPTDTSVPPAQNPTPTKTKTPKPPTPTPTPTEFVPIWGSCSWVGVEKNGINSHQPNTWCPNGSFLVGLDQDRCSCTANDSPVIGQAQCCSLQGGQLNSWGSCSWVGVQQGGINSHQPSAWCPEGSYITGLDLDGGPYDDMDAPVVGQAQCCSLPAPITEWASCQWVGVNSSGVNSHQPNTWCPNGSFMVGFDLDREGSYDPMDSPVIGQAYCCYPGD